MDRTFGKPARSPVPLMLLVATAYGLGAGLFFVREAIFCAGLTTQTVSGLLLCFAIVALTGAVAAIGRHRLIWMIPLLFWTVVHLLSLLGVVSSYVAIHIHGETVCGIA